MNESISEVGDCKAAPTTPGLLKKIVNRELRHFIPGSEASLASITLSSLTALLYCAKPKVAQSLDGDYGIGELGDLGIRGLRDWGIRGLGDWEIGGLGD